MVCSTLLQVTCADKLTLVCRNLLVGSVRISFAMRSIVYLLKLSPKFFTKKLLATCYHFMFIEVHHINVYLIIK
jgi:hypothetical protein